MLQTVRINYRESLVVNLLVRSRVDDDQGLVPDHSYEVVIIRDENTLRVQLLVIEIYQLVELAIDVLVACNIPLVKILREGLDQIGC